MDVSLTVVIPTADRHEYLPETISCLMREIRGCDLEIPIIVADNASDPAVTIEMLGFKKELPHLSIKRFDDRVSIGASIVRSSKLASTEYVWVFGDDDLIVDHGLSTIIKVLNESRPDYLYINRFIAPHSMKRMQRIEHRVTRPFVEYPISGVDAIARFTHHPGFITSLIVKRGAFDDAVDLEGSFPGYGFLAALYSRFMHGKVAFISMPLLVQRKSKTLWRSSWPIYWLVSVPALFEWLEQKGASGAYKAAMREVERSSLWTALLAKASNISCIDHFWISAARHQSGVNRIMFSFIRWMMPVWGAKKVVETAMRFKEWRE